MLIGNSLAGYIKRGILIGRSNNRRDTCLQLHAILLCERLERHGALIVVHGKHTVELLIEILAKELIGHVGTKRLYLPSR